MDVENVATRDATRPTSPEESFPADHRTVSIKEGRGEPMLDRRKGRPLAEKPQQARLIDERSPTGGDHRPLGQHPQTNADVLVGRRQPDPILEVIGEHSVGRCRSRRGSIWRLRCDAPRPAGPDPAATERARHPCRRTYDCHVSPLFRLREGTGTPRSTSHSDEEAESDEPARRARQLGDRCRRLTGAHEPRPCLAPRRARDRHREDHPPAKDSGRCRGRTEIAGDGRPSERSASRHASFNLSLTGSRQETERRM